jgi:hypothetical protein
MLPPDHALPTSWALNAQVCGVEPDCFDRVVATDLEDCVAGPSRVCARLPDVHRVGEDGLNRIALTGVRAAIFAIRRPSALSTFGRGVAVRRLR